MKRKTRLFNKWSVFKENNPSSHIFIMIILINLLFIVVSSALLIFLPENEGRGFFEMLRFAFTLMVNPSGRYIYSDYPISLIITTIVVLLGMISLTGGTVGYITSVINSMLEKSAKSENRIRLKDHIVILNYNNRVPALIQDYIFDDIDSTYITILSNCNKDMVKNDLEAAYQKSFSGKKFKNLIIREGNPLSRADLDNISLQDAKTVIIVAPDLMANQTSDDINSMYEVAKLFMYISLYYAENHNENKTNIVVEADKKEMEELIRNYKVDNLHQISIPINYTDIIGKTLAVTTMMPGIYDVLQILFSFEAVELYIEDKPDGISIAEELQTSRSALPLFDMDNKRIYVAENESEIGRKSRKSNTIERESAKTIIEPSITFEDKSILIIGTSNKLDSILESFSCFSKEYDAKISVILADTEENLPKLLSCYNNPLYSNILDPEQNAPIVLKDKYHPVNDIGIERFEKIHSVLFLSDECVPEARIDEKPILYWSGLKNISSELPNQSLIVEVLSAQNNKIIEKKTKDQTIVSDSFLGHFYAQLGKCPERLDIIKDLLTTEEDSSAINSNQESQDEADLLIINVKKFFAGAENEDLTFRSKRELINWIYTSTDQTYIPIGCIKNGVVYMFSRTDTEDDSLDSPVLRGPLENNMLTGTDSCIKLEEQDDLVVIKTK